MTLATAVDAVDIKWLKKTVESIKPQLEQGRVSDYLPELAKSKKEDFAVAVSMADGREIRYGTDRKFTVQSVVKVITLLMAFQDNGVDSTLEKCGCDQPYGPYNSIRNFDPVRKQTANPFVNAGALVVLDSLLARDGDHLVERVLGAMRALGRNNQLIVDRGVAESEYAISTQNREIGHFLSQHGALSRPVEEVLWAYCQICSTLVDTIDLARIAATLSTTGSFQLPSVAASRESLTAIRRVLLTTGMYEASSGYASRVGLPAKCGVSGSMLAIVPGLGGVGVFGPALDSAGNSVGGLAFMRALAQQLDTL